MLDSFMTGIQCEELEDDYREAMKELHEWELHTGQGFDEESWAMWL